MSIGTNPYSSTAIVGFNSSIAASLGQSSEEETE